MSPAHPEQQRAAPPLTLPGIPGMVEEAVSKEGLPDELLG